MNGNNVLALACLNVALRARASRPQREG